MASFSREARVKDLAAARAREKKRLREWRERNPERYRAQQRSSRHLLDDVAFAAMLAAQRGLCALCRFRKGDCVDHCHATGRVRAILCRRCNAGFGQFRDDPELLEAAARYLEERAPGLEKGADVEQ
jgi:hypothetical protein